MQEKIIKLIKQKNITHVVGVYPDLDFIELARSASNIANVKFYSYLHDTIYEGLKHTSYKKLSKNIQSKVFKTSQKVFVISDGMRDLFDQKYNIKAITLPHSFSENMIEKFMIKILKNQFFGVVVSIQLTK